MPTEQTNLRLDTEIKGRAIAAAEAAGMPLARLVERALLAYLDGPIEVVAPGSVADSRVVADLIARVEALEQAMLPGDSEVVAVEPAAHVEPALGIPRAEVATPTHTPKQPRKDAQQEASKPVQVSGHLAGLPQKADGRRWLTTTQAVQVSQGRGGPDNGNTLKRWGRRGETESIGLRWIARPPSRDNSLASFQDLRWGE